ncbi:replication factor-A carboxy-terminal domain protein, partial [Trifolium medium]|nr:replication factor-A carboxy-terminal domain protein [Trifolium medium]
LTSQETKCVTVVNTIKVKPTKNGWYYLTCFKCPKQCFGEAPPYKCTDQHETETEIIRYKLDVEVGDGHVKATFVFWDRECEQLIGKSAAELRAEMLQAGIHDPLDYPADMDKIAGKTLAVKVKWQARWKTGSVIQINQGDDFINEIHSQFPPANGPQGQMKAVNKKLLIEVSKFLHHDLITC